MNNETSNEKTDIKASVSKLFNYIRPFLPQIIIAILCASIDSVMLIKGATEVSDLVDVIKDMILGKASFDKLKKISFKIIAMFSVFLVFSVIQGMLASFIQKKIICRLREDLELKRQKLPYGTIARLNTGNTLSIITNDVSKFSISFNAVAIELLPAVILFSGTMFTMFTKSVILTLSVLVSAVIGFCLIGVIMFKSQKYYVCQQEILGDINGHIEEIFSGEIVVKAFGREKSEIEKFDVLNDKMRSMNYKTFCFQALLMPIMTLINNLGYIAVCIIGAILISDKAITFGIMASFLMYLNLFQGPIGTIGSTSQNIQTILSSSKRIFDFLDIEEAPPEKNKALTCINNIDGYVSFDRLFFGYEPDEKIVINDFSLEIKCGQKVAIVGQTGAGKTTLINLLLRFYNINSGDIQIDGIPINDFSMQSLRDLFSIVPQDTWIFNGTIRENLVLSLNGITDDKLDEVCEAVGIYRYITMLPNGYDTVISEKDGLSAGQKQQISIARAMLADKKMIILDEATSSVDVLLEKQIQTSMDKLIKDKTAFIIAHRLSTIKNADVIIVMKDGNIAEIGNHSELLEYSGVYAEMLRSQWDV